MADKAAARKIGISEEFPLHRTLERGLPALYYQLADVFRRRIEDGAWLVDTQIPTLDELVAEFGAARATVRQALTILESEGLLARYRGRGSFVLKRPVRDPAFTIDTNWLSLVGQRPTVKRELLSAEIAATPPVPSHGGGTLAPEYGHFVRRHSVADTPYAVRFGYLDRRLWNQITRDQMAAAPLVRTLIDRTGVKLERCEQTITISAADFEIARLLDVSLNTPIAVVDRSAFDPGDVLVLETRGYYRGDMVKIDMTLV
jgi:GntR family transcriptional regulator